MSGIAPILDRIATIESRFGGRPAAPVQTIGSSDQFEQALAAAEETLPLAGPTAPASSDPTAYLRPPNMGTNRFLAVVAGTSPAATPTRPVAAASGIPTTTDVPAGTPFAAEFARAAADHEVPGGLLAAVGWVESRYDVSAVSPDGAVGVMQLMPGTAADLGVDARDPADAIDGAARLLRGHFDRFGSWDLALAAYFSGPGAVAAAGNQAPPRGAAYAQRVLQRMEDQ